MSNSSVRSIIDMPDEILVKIILCFDARERLALGNSCQKFNDLVFGDEELLRNLDFSKKEYLTSDSDINEYFKNKNTYEKIRRMNIERVWTVSSSLSSSIGKSINLVELNILMSGFRFDSVGELSSFLKPLVNLKRLSFDWPGSSMQTNEWNQVLKEPFTRLTYLSLKIHCYTNEFLLILQLCQQLEELRMLVLGKVDDFESPSREELMKLSKLEFVRLSAGKYSGQLRRHIMSIIPNPAEWTDLYLNHSYNEIYLERNIEICPELSRVKEMPLPLSAVIYREKNSINEGWALVPENLLSEAIRVTHDDTPKRFCCLSLPASIFDQPCMMEIDEAKKLLNDPGYQISCLNFTNEVEKNCDVHLLASAFPNLTKLVISGISNKNSMLAPERIGPLRRRLRKKTASVQASDECSDARNTDSSFKILIENTPRLKFLQIFSNLREDDVDYWDFDALDMISGWKNLTVISLSDIPIRDGKFLIDIGKECKKLEVIKLDLSHNSSYENELLQMLQHCEHLKELSIWGMSLKNMSQMFDILSQRSQLEDIELGNTIQEYKFLELMSSFQNMLCNCQNLSKFSTHLRQLEVCNVLVPAMGRIISELDRPNFKFDYTGPQ